MVIAAKALVGVLAIVAGVVADRWPRLYPLTNRQFHWAIAAGWLSSRVAVFVGLYIILAEPVSSDVSGYYYPQALRALNGELIYRDFASSYAPLFPYAVATALRWIWASPLVIVAMAIVAEGVALLFWVWATSHLFDVTTRRRAAVFYVVSALPLVNVAVEGQNQVWVSVFLGAALLLLVKGRSTAAAVTASIPFVLVKLLALLGAPAFLSRRGRPARFAVTFLVLPCVVYGGLLLYGVNVFVPLRQERFDQTSGNIPFIVGTLLGTNGWSIAPMALDVVAIACLATVACWLALRDAPPSGEQVVWSTVLLYATFMLVSKKAYSSYLVMAFFPACIVAATTRSRWFGPFGFGIFGAAAMIERSLWFRWMEAGRPVDMVAAFRTTGVLRGGLFLAVEGVILASYIYLWAVCRKRLAGNVVPPTGHAALGTS